MGNCNSNSKPANRMAGRMANKRQPNNVQTQNIKHSETKSTENRKHKDNWHVWSNGAKYKGEWKDGLMHGQGECRWLNGSQYKGEWKDNKRNGHGIYVYADG